MPKLGTAHKGLNVFNDVAEVTTRKGGQKAY